MSVVGNVSSLLFWKKTRLMVDEGHMGQCCLPWACTLRKEDGSGFVDSGAGREETEMCHCFIHHMLCKAAQSFFGRILL